MGDDGASRMGHIGLDRRGNLGVGEGRKRERSWGGSWAGVGEMIERTERE